MAYSFSISNILDNSSFDRQEKDAHPPVITSPEFSADTSNTAHKRKKTGRDGSATGKRRNRNNFSHHQVAILEEHYKRNNFIQAEEKQNLANILGLEVVHVKYWFQNRRSKDKRLGIEPVNPNTSSSNHSTPVKRIGDESSGMMHGSFDSDDEFDRSVSTPFEGESYINEDSMGSFTDNNVQTYPHLNPSPDQAAYLNRSSPALPTPATHFNASLLNSFGKVPAPMINPVQAQELARQQPNLNQLQDSSVVQTPMSNFHTHPMRPDQKIPMDHPGLKIASNGYNAPPEKTVNPNVLINSADQHIPARPHPEIGLSYLNKQGPLGLNSPMKRVAQDPPEPHSQIHKNPLIGANRVSNHQLEAAIHSDKAVPQVSIPKMNPAVRLNNTRDPGQLYPGPGLEHGNGFMPNIYQQSKPLDEKQTRVQPETPSVLQNPQNPKPASGSNHNGSLPHPAPINPSRFPDYSINHAGLPPNLPTHRLHPEEQLKMMNSPHKIRPGPHRYHNPGHTDTKHNVIIPAQHQQVLALKQRTPSHNAPNYPHLLSTISPLANEPPPKTCLNDDRVQKKYEKLNSPAKVLTPEKVNRQIFPHASLPPTESGSMESGHMEGSRCYDMGDPDCWSRIFLNSSLLDEKNRNCGTHTDVTSIKSPPKVYTIL